MELSGKNNRFKQEEDQRSLFSKKNALRLEGILIRSNSVYAEGASSAGAAVSAAGATSTAFSAAFLRPPPPERRVFLADPFSSPFL